MHSRSPMGSWSGPSSGPFAVVPDILALLGVFLFTLTLQSFQSTQWFADLLKLSPEVYRGFVWQILSYPFVSLRYDPFWFVLTHFFLYLFAKDVFQRLGRVHFWKLLIQASAVGGMVAVAIGFLIWIWGTPQNLFAVIQGQQMVFLVVICAFALLKPGGVVFFSFVIPIKAKWFIPIEVVFLFVKFLGSKDLAGFLGGITTILFVIWYLNPSLLSGRGRMGWLKLQEWWFRKQMRQKKKRKGFRVIEGGKGSDHDSWVN